MYRIMMCTKGLPPIEISSRMYFRDAIDYAYFNKEYIDCDFLIYKGKTLIAALMSD